MPRMVSESNTRGSSNGKLAGRCGREPVAMRKTSAFRRIGSPVSCAIETVCGSVKEVVTLGTITTSVPVEIRFNPRLLGFGDVLLMEQEIACCDVIAHRQRDAMQPALPEAGQVQRSLAQRLRGQGSGIRGGAAQDARVFHQRDSLAEIGRLCGSLFASRAGTDDHQIRRLNRGIALSVQFRWG